MLRCVKGRNSQLYEVLRRLTTLCLYRGKMWKNSKEKQWGNYSSLKLCSHDNIFVLQ